ncbi:hypothetical protein [Massilia timonae]|uniref:Uncharacterized protein n=1 Tax=Massilia timonae CCUG 45783 TaxID=883126 RepID=K9D6N0_9BURK|nr:hypothetical protein [Massilia timonae]EKU80289.1 hypothetical protein HMPREF9710_04401 [Massilia timonae CCUG 45783]
MAAGWWTVLKTVPWSEVISAAPQVATGARRLWDTVNRKPGAVDPATGLSPEMAAQEDDIIGLLIARSEQNDAELNDLRNQMRSASELIANLADQNAQLIAKMDVQRQKLTWLGVTAGLSALLSVVALILVAVRT